MVKAGATRIGTSAGVNIVREFENGEILEQEASHAAY
jgi:deoxyribose-phosphate aldolase